MKKFLSLLLSLCMVMGLATQAFAAGNSTDVLLESDVTAPDVLNVVVPAEIPIHMSAAGDIQVASTLAIENKSSKAVEVQAVRAEGKNGWAILDWDADFSDKPTGTKDLALSFRGDGTGSDGQIALTSGNWRIEKDGSLPIEAGAKLPLQTETAKTSIATVYWTVDFADGGSSVDPDPDPGDGIEIAVLPGKHGMADTDVLYPDADGLVAEYPGVTADTGYDFTHFADADTGDTVDTSTVYTVDGAIRPMFELKSGWTSVSVPETPGVTFEPKDDPEILIDPDGVVQVVPDVKPDDGYKTDGFVDETTGESVVPGSVIDITINITINVYPDGGNPGGGDEPDPDDKTVTVPVLPGEHGSADADSVTTGSDGKIDPFPGTTPDEGYVFDHWEDQDGNPVDGGTVLDDGDSIKPVFKPDPDYKPDLTVTVDILPGEHGTCEILTVTTTSEGKIHTYPDVTPDEGWVLDHWENQDGEFVDENTVWSEGEGARPVYVEDPDYTSKIILTVLPGKNGNASVDTIEVGTDGKVSVWPEVTPDDGYKFSHWRDHAGTKLDSETVFTESKEVFPVCVAVPTKNFTITAENREKVGYHYGVTELVIPDKFWDETDGCYYVPTAIAADAFEDAGSNPDAWWETTAFSCYIPDTVTSIGDGAFVRAYLTSVRLPSKLTAIPDNCFSRSTLTDVTIPSSVKSIGSHAFFYCPLDSIEIPNSVTTMGSSAFSGSSITHVSLSANCSVIPSDCFVHCGNLTDVSIPYGVRELGNGAFQKCGLTSIEMPSSMKIIGNVVFLGNSQLTNVTLNNGLLRIGNSSFSECAISYLRVPSSVVTISEYAFSGVDQISYSGSASGDGWWGANERV